MSEGNKELASSSVTELPQGNEYARNWSYCKITKRWVLLALPFTGSRVADIVGELGVGVVLSSLGSEYLAANALIVTIRRFVFGFGLGTLYSISTLIGREDNKRDIGEIVRQGSILAVVVSVPSLALACSSEPILKLLGQNHKVAAIVQDYYVGAAFSVPGMFLSSVFAHFTLGIGKPRISLIANSVNNLVSLGVGSMLTFGWFGMPELSVRGLGYGYSIGSVLTMLGCALYLLLDKQFHAYQLNRFNLKHFRLLGSLLSEGAPFGLQIAFDYLNLYVISIVTGLLGTNALTAARVAEMIYMPLLVLIMRAPQATCKLSGKAIVEGNEQLVKKLVHVNIGVLEVVTISWAVTASLLSKQLTGLLVDINDPKNSSIASLAQTMFWLYPLGLGAEIVRYAAGGSCRSFKKTRVAMVNSFFWLNLLGLPLVGLAYSLDEGLPGLYAARNISLAAAACAISLHWRHIRNRVFHPDAKMFSGVRSVTQRVYTQVSGWMPSLFHKQSVEKLCINHEESLPLLEDQSITESPQFNC
ncbi:MAG: hypothetical protein KAS93_01400 [Gammaproteobacteria bacterium]|nr:hypothetical protein [Gammaproteobacteria bacterium]